MSERNETVEEFLARGGRIERSSKIIGAKSLNMFSKFDANYRAGSGKTRAVVNSWACCATMPFAALPWCVDRCPLHVCKMQTYLRHLLIVMHVGEAWHGTTDRHREGGDTPRKRARCGAVKRSHSPHVGILCALEPRSLWLRW